MTYGITGLSPLGTLGLGAMGGFGSYDMYMPSSMGMNPMMYGGLGGYGGYGMGMMDPYGMMMNYPVFMAQAQNQMEELQVKHAGNMHGLYLQNEVRGHEQTDSALISKILTNGSVQQGIYSLHQKVKEGDQNGICEQYDKLKTEIYNTYSKEFQARGSNVNPAIVVNDIIEKLYGSIISAQEGTTQDLRTNIKKYGDGAFQNGFMKGFRMDHHERDIDSTLNHIYGERIDHKGYKDRTNTIGTGVGYVARGAEVAAIGGAAGVGATYAGIGAIKGLGKIFGKDWIHFSGKGKIAAGIGLATAIAAIVGDAIWRQQSA